MPVVSWAERAPDGGWADWAPLGGAVRTGGAMATVFPRPVLGGSSSRLEFLAGSCGAPCPGAQFCRSEDVTSADVAGQPSLEQPSLEQPSLEQPSSATAVALACDSPSSPHTAAGGRPSAGPSGSASHREVCVPGRPPPASQGGAAPPAGCCWRGHDPAGAGGMAAGLDGLSAGIAPRPGLPASISMPA